MQIDLSGKTAFITGSTAGIGLAIAKGMAGAGADVWINGRTQARVDAALAEIGGSAKGIAADLTKPSDVARVFETLPEADILVNNLGIYDGQDFFDIDDDTWMHFWDVNVMTGVRMSRHYAKGMAQRRWGRVQFISSESGVNVSGELVHYGVTKAAQLALTRGLAVNLAGTNVTVNSILPGPTRSEGIDGFLTQMAKDNDITIDEAGKRFVTSFRPSTIIQRIAQTDEVAALSVYLASPQASATTGAPMRVDGGIVATIV